MVYKTRTEEETLQLGKEMAAGLKGGDVVLLHGGLGAGKSVFTMFFVSLMPVSRS